jgi:hypothetical protein
VVLVSGEPGIGNSCNAETIVERLSGEPQTRLRYFCSPHHQDSAREYHGARTSGRFPREDTDKRRLAKLELCLPWRSHLPNPTSAARLATKGGRCETARPPTLVGQPLGASPP